MRGWFPCGVPVRDLFPCRAGGCGVSHAGLVPVRDFFPCGAAGRAAVLVPQHPRERRWRWALLPSPAGSERCRWGCREPGQRPPEEQSAAGLSVPCPAPQVERAGGNLPVPVPGRRRGFAGAMRNEFILLGIVPGGEGADVWRRLRGMSRRRSRERSAQPGRVQLGYTAGTACSSPGCSLRNSSCAWQRQLRHIAPDRARWGSFK